MDHTFNKDLAVSYGLNIATFMNNLAYWTIQNSASRHHFYDNRYWMYNSLPALAIVFPYWTTSQIRTIIKNCISGGLIVTGNYNKHAYDRTQWFSMTELGMSFYSGLSRLTNCKPNRDENGVEIDETQAQLDLLELTDQAQPHLSILADASVNFSTTIPMVNPNVILSVIPARAILPNTFEESYYQPRDQSEQLAVTADLSNQTFDEFYKLYPIKKNELRARAMWLSQNCHEISALILDKLKLQIEKDAQFRDGYVPNPDNYISGERWNDEVQEVRSKQNNRTPEKTKIDWHDTSWIHSMNTDLLK